MKVQAYFAAQFAHIALGWFGSFGTIINEVLRASRMKPRRGIYIDNLPLLIRNDDICNLEEAFLDHLELTDVSDSFPLFSF